MKLNGRKINYIIQKMSSGKSTRQVGEEVRISHERVRQIYISFKNTGRIPEIKQVGRPKKKLSESEVNLILEGYLKYKASASILRKIIKQENNISINHNKIHEILLENNMAQKEPKKSVRKKPWVRYERLHSLSAVHMDWMYDEKIGKHIVAVIDDASRKILSYGEFDSATVENTILVLREALKYGKIREVITDRGSQFTSNKFDKKGNHRSKFAEFCKLNGIKQILCRVKHPQSNGKIERWFGLYRQKRYMFQNLQEFVYWYNRVKPHLSLNMDVLETPEQAFRRKFKE
jgi:putative transposase